MWDIPQTQDLELYGEVFTNELQYWIPWQMELTVYDEMYVCEMLYLIEYGLPNHGLAS